MSETTEKNEITLPFMSETDIAKLSVSALSNRPNERSGQYGKKGLTPEEVKEAFSALPVAIAARMNEILPKLLEAFEQTDANIEKADAVLDKKIDTEGADIRSNAIGVPGYDAVTGKLTFKTLDGKKEVTHDLPIEKIIKTVGLSDDGKKLIFKFVTDADLEVDVSALTNPEWAKKIAAGINTPPETGAIKKYIDDEALKKVSKLAPDYEDGSKSNVYGMDASGNTVAFKGDNRSTPNTLVHRDADGYFEVSHPISLEHPVSKMFFDNKHNNSLYEEFNRLNVALAELEAAVNGDKYTPVTIDSEFVATRIDKAMPYGVLSYLRQVPQATYPKVNASYELQGLVTNGEADYLSNGGLLYRRLQYFVDGRYLYLKPLAAYSKMMSTNPCSLVFMADGTDPYDVHQYRVSLDYNRMTYITDVVVEERYSESSPEWKKSVNVSMSNLLENASYVTYYGLPAIFFVGDNRIECSPYVSKIRIGYAFDITNVTNSSDKIISNVNGVITMPKGSLYYAKIPCEILPDTSVDVYFKTSVDDSRDKINSVRLLTGTKTQITAVNDFSSTPVSLVNTKMAAYIAFYKKEPSKESYGAMQVTDVDVKFADANYSTVVRVTHEITIPTSVTSREGYGNPDSYIDFVNRRFFDATANEMVDLSAVLPEDISTLPLSNGVTITFLDAEGNQTIAHPTINYIVDNTEV